MMLFQARHIGRQRPQILLAQLLVGWHGGALDHRRGILQVFDMPV